jgi:hypothetical protein
MSANGCTIRISTCLYILIVFLFVAVFIPEASCAPDRVPIPEPGQDQAPIITVSALASGGGADIQYVPASSSVCASPCKNSVKLRDKNGAADIVLTINAENPKGGVQDLGVIVSQNHPLYKVSRSATPNAQNLVPLSLSILGTNKKGGIGSYPILIHLSKKQTNATVLVEAGNFNRQRSLYAVTYYVPEVTAKLSASKNEIYTDEETTLKWETKDAESIEIKPPLPGVQPPSPRELNGSRTVKFHGAGTTKYTLSARNWLETATSSTTIKVNKRPNLGGSLVVGLNFTCTGERIYAKATFEGHCVSNCNKPGPNSGGMFMNTVPETVRCAGGSGVYSKSFADLESGDWKVTVTPNVPSMNLIGPPTTCAPVTIKAGEYNHRVDFYYEKDPQTYGWTGSCRRQ